MMHRRFLSFPLAVVGVALAALGVFAATEEEAPVSPPGSIASPEVVIVVADELPPTSSCDIDPDCSRQLPSGLIDPGFSVTVAADGAWKDIDPGFSVRLPCPLDTMTQRFLAAATPAP